MKWHSEYGEDQWIDENLSLPLHGFYLDVGAGHPVVASNTAFLRDKGWDGISIDAQRFVQDWPGTFIQAAISDTPIVSFSPNGFSGKIADGGYMIAALSLAQVIYEMDITSLDFMSLDIEGHEFAAFNSFDWESMPPKVIVAEYNTHGATDFRLRDQLLAFGYKAVHQTIANIIYTLH